MRWLWNIWKHLSMSTFPFLPICCVLWVQGSDGWKAESNSWSFHLAKMKRQLQGKPKENIFQLFSLLFLSPFLSLVITFSYEKKFGLIVLSFSQHKSIYSKVSMSVPYTSSMWDLRLPGTWSCASPPSFLGDTKEDHAFLLGTSEESALQFSLCRSWC